jgi:hypothetical protein
VRDDLRLLGDILDKFRHVPHLQMKKGNPVITFNKHKRGEL